MAVWLFAGKVFQNIFKVHGLKVLTVINQQDVYGFPDGIRSFLREVKIDAQISSQFIRGKGKGLQYSYFGVNGRHISKNREFICFYSILKINLDAH
jgi:hypothetical protein